MVKRIFILMATTVLFLTSVTAVWAAPIDKGDYCDPKDPARKDCISGYSCQPSKTDASTYLCQTDVFGKITPPEALKNLVGADPSGTKGVSIFFSRLVSLMYALAGLVLILMLIWGAWDWLTSEGDKEKLHSAQRKLINAIIGIILFAAAFAVISLLEAFTGFSFFKN